MNIISMPSNQFRLIDSGRAANSGSLYIGKINTDPTVLSNQLPVTAMKTDGTTSAISQPITLNSNGIPVDSLGNTVTLSVEMHYSVTILDAYGKIQQNIPINFVEEIGSFAALRTLPVFRTGQKVYLRSWHEGQVLGGGEFVGFTGSATDDGGVIAAGNGFYWQRVERLSLDLTMFGAIPNSISPTFDSTNYVQKAFDYASKASASEITVSGFYNIFSTTTTLTLPGDDGTVYPGWVNNGDINLSPETIYTQPVCLKITGKVTIRGSDLNKDGFVGNWSINSSPINTDQPIGILFTAGSKYKGTVVYNLININISNFFIGRVVEGTAEQSFEQIKVSNCAIAGIFQGIERCSAGTLHFSSNYTGDIHGGWWTQRNDTNNNPYLPPYPATDVWSLGWTDFYKVDFVVYGQAYQAFGDRHKSVDTYFDTYFYKNANSAKTSAGGRLSNNTGGIASKMSPYRGVVGRALTVYSRYGRAAASYDIKSVKVLGPHRAPFFFNNENGIVAHLCSISSIYLEGVGLIQLSLGSSAPGNFFGVNNRDIYRDEGYGIGYLVAHGFSSDKVVLSSNCQLAAFAANGSGTSNPLSVSITHPDKGAKQTRDPFTISVFDDTGYRIISSVNEKRAVLPHGALGAYEDFVYAGKINFTPSLSANGVPFTNFGSALGTGKIIGKIFFFSLKVFKNGALAYPSGPLTITGLPVSVIGGQNFLSGFEIRSIVGATDAMNLKVKISGSTLTIASGITGNDFNGSNLNTSDGNAPYIFFDITGYYEIA